MGNIPRFYNKRDLSYKKLTKIRYEPANLD